MGTISKDLICGFEFAIKHNLTQREMEILVLFLEKPLTTLESASILKANPKTLYNQIQRLKFKDLLILKSKDSKGNNLYMFNESILG